MNEHLFKLTRASVKIGYLNLEGANPCYGGAIGSYPYGAYEFGEMMKNSYGTDFSLSDFDAHPFVTKDKNGKDVFADDKVRSKNGLREYKVAWDERQCRWWLWGIGKAWAVNTPVWEDYELIEAKEDKTS